MESEGVENRQRIFLLQQDNDQSTIYRRFKVISDPHEHKQLRLESILRLLDQSNSMQRTPGDFDFLEDRIDFQLSDSECLKARQCSQQEHNYNRTFEQYIQHHMPLEEELLREEARRASPAQGPPLQEMARQTPQCAQPE